MTAAGASYALGGTRFRVRWVPETGSTNADLLAAARAGADEGEVLVADHQTAGRGRLGRTWEAPAGAGLLVSILLRPRLATEEVHLVTTALAVAAAEAVAEAGGLRPGLKWPNDLVLATPGGERKLAGILAESVVEGDRVAAVVVGMGINVAWDGVTDLPADVRAVGVALDEVGLAIERKDLLEGILRRFEPRYDDLGAPAGRERLLADYRRACTTLGREVRVELARGARTGRAVGLGPGGQLLVEPDGGGGTVEIAAGDVTHLRDR